MAEVTSKYGKSYNYDYYTAHINLDKSNPYQSKCIKILEKVGRKKNQLISILINQFIAEYENFENLSDKEMKQFLEYLELSSKMNGKMPTSFSGNNMSEMHIEPGKIENRLHELAKQAPVAEPVIEEEPQVQEEPVMNSEDIFSAMNMFSV